MGISGKNKKGGKAAKPAKDGKKMDKKAAAPVLKRGTTTDSITQTDGLFGKVSVGTITSEGTLVLVDMGNQTEAQCRSRSMCARELSIMSCGQQPKYDMHAPGTSRPTTTRSLETIRKRVAEIKQKLQEEDKLIQEMQGIQQENDKMANHMRGHPTDTAHASFKAQALDYAKSGQYYVTPEVMREVKHLDNGVNHIRLDKDFVTSDKAWGEKWRPKGANQEIAEAAGSIQCAAGTVCHVKGRMTAREITALQDNQVRERHHETISDLRRAEENMGPYAHHSIDRLKQYADFVGVTDRYTGYRNNLNRGAKEADRAIPSWVEQQKTYNPAHQQSRTPRHPEQAAPSYDQGSPSPSLNRGQLEDKKKSVPEMAGINVKFPGQTEYTDRYVHEPKSESSVPFTANPQPNMMVNDRSQAQVGWEPRNTEYQRRYNWPDSSAKSAMPWARY